MYNFFYCFCSWFVVYCISMNNINYLISSDNKGLVVQMFEVDMNKGVFLGKVRFGYDILFLILM